MVDVEAGRLINLVRLTGAEYAGREGIHGSMIQDKAILENIRKDWEYARSRRDFIMRQAFINAGTGLVPLKLMDFANNLALLFAYSVLQGVLAQLRDEGRFVEKRSALGPLMAAGEHKLPWTDFALVDAGREERNKVAHEQKVLPRGDCWKYMDAIEHEFASWGILTCQVTGR